jgi:hypothetical protein
MSYKFNVFTGTFDIVGVAVVTPPSTGDGRWELEAAIGTWLQEDGTSFWLIEA